MSSSTQQQQQQQQDNEQQQKKQKDSESDSESESESESESDLKSDLESDSDSDSDSKDEGEFDDIPESDNYPEDNEQQQKKQKDSESDLKSDLESDSDSDSDSKDEGEFDDIPESYNYPEAKIKRLARYLNSRPRRDAVKDYYDSQEKEFDFPKDEENWREADLRELWADAPMVSPKTGWDPVWADKNDWKIVENQRRRGNDPPIAPFYIPYRKPYPAVPYKHPDISDPKALIEELDRIEEFLKWVSYIFADGSSYEGTVWDDAAHGKGVYVAEQGLVRYEGEWLQNDMEGHGVVEVDVPDIEPIPGSELEAEMRAEGKIIKRDFMNPEDREWLEMDIEDSVRLTDGNYEIPFYENDEWIRQFGQKPEKGRYRYAGQWKHGRMHGCGVYEVNERPIFGRFYFGELVEEETDCDEKASVLHAGIAEVAAAKARMFVNKPDGMVREERGPYGDPQHPYFYEEDDVWQAPGFINQFYEVPDYWKTYVHEVDEEREMWLNSFYKAPLRLPMPAELEHWWQNDTPPEFVLLNKEPEPDPDDPSKSKYTEDPVILHTPTGRIINYVDDEEHGIRLFWQPPLKEGEDVDPSKVEFLPLGFDEFYGREVVVPKGSFLKRLVRSIENTLKPWFDKLDKWTEEQKKASKIRRELLEQELELMEAELELEEVLQDLDEALKLEEKEAEKKVDIDGQEEGVIVEQGEEEVTPPKEIEDEEDDEEEEDEDEDDLAPSSFGTVVDSGSSKDKKNERGKSPFSTLSIASSGLLSMVPSLLERSFCMWKKERCPPKGQTLSVISQDCIKTINCPDSLTFCQPFPVNLNLRMKSQINHKFRAKQPVRKSASTPDSSPSSCQSTCAKDCHKGQKLSRLHWLHTSPETYSDLILSLNIPVQCLNTST